MQSASKPSGAAAKMSSRWAAAGAGRTSSSASASASTRSVIGGRPRGLARGGAVAAAAGGADLRGRRGGGAAAMAMVEDSVAVARAHVRGLGAGGAARGGVFNPTKDTLNQDCGFAPFRGRGRFAGAMYPGKWD